MFNILPYLLALSFFLVACATGKNPYYQDNLVEIIDQECNLAEVCTYTVEHDGVELTVPEEDLEWK